MEEVGKRMELAGKLSTGFLITGNKEKRKLFFFKSTYKCYILYSYYILFPEFTLLNADKWYSHGNSILRPFVYCSWNNRIL